MSDPPPVGAPRRLVRALRPDRRYFRRDLLAGLPGAISSVPDGMASGVLAGVNPVQGLYASLAGPIAGGFGVSTRLMVVTTTSAAALAAGSAVSGLEAAERADAVMLLSVLAGLFMVVAGLLRLGRYTRFVSHSVMLGFLSGVAVNIAFGQVPDLTGAPSEGSVNLARALNVFLHPSEIDLASLLVGLGAIGLLVVLARTALAVVSALVALVLPTVIVVVAGLDSVARVEDAGAIPEGLPLPGLPDLGLLSFNLVAGAAAVAAIVLVQGAGVAESAPNPEGPSNSNRDFIAQGAGNLAAGFLKGMPVGGSVGQTAVNKAAGARTRWAAIWSGLWMIVILVAFSGLVGKVATPTLAGVLIFAGIGSLRPREISTILRTGPNSQIAFVSTLAATLFLPVAVAVGLGVVLSLLLQLNQEAMDLRVVQLVDEDGRLLERPAPTALASDSVTVLEVYGSLFYAGARTLQSRLPDPAGATNAAVVLRLRGRTSLGATFFTVVAAYAERLEALGGRLYLTGLDPNLAHRLRGNEDLPLTGTARLFAATEAIGESTHAALEDIETWRVTG